LKDSRESTRTLIVSQKTRHSPEKHALGVTKLFVFQ